MWSYVKEVPYFGHDNTISHDLNNLQIIFKKKKNAGAGGDKLEYLHGAVISQPEPGVE